MEPVAAVQKVFCHLHIRIKVQVRVSSPKVFVTDHALPAAAPAGFLCNAAVAAVLAVPVVEFVGGKALPFFAQQVVLLRGQANLAEPAQGRGAKAAARQKADHRVGFGIGALQLFAEVLKAAAFGNAGQAVLQRGFYLCHQRAVLAEGVGIQLGIAAAEQQAVQIIGQLRVVQRRNSTSCAPSCSSSSRLSA